MLLLRATRLSSLSRICEPVEKIRWWFLLNRWWFIWRFCIIFRNLKYLSLISSEEFTTKYSEGNHSLTKCTYVLVHSCIEWFEPRKTSWCGRVTRHCGGNRSRCFRLKTRIRINSSMMIKQTQNLYWIHHAHDCMRTEFRGWRWKIPCWMTQRKSTLKTTEWRFQNDFHIIYQLVYPSRFG